MVIFPNDKHRIIYVREEKIWKRCVVDTREKYEEMRSSLLSITWENFSSYTERNAFQYTHRSCGFMDSTKYRRKIEMVYGDNAETQYKSQEIVIGYLKAKVSNKSDEGIISKFELVTRNKREKKKWAQQCTAMCKVVSKSCYSRTPKTNTNMEKNFMWKKEKYNLADIIIKQNFRNAVFHWKTYSGVDGGRDHLQVMCRYRVKVGNWRGLMHYPN